MEKFDVVVIGGGPAGYPAAIRAAQLGGKVALVEKERLGGTCLNWGCIPTKTLIASADAYQRIRRAADLGISAGNLSFDYAVMSDRKDAVTDKLRSGIQQLLKAHGVTVVQGEATLAGRDRIDAQTSDGRRALQARRVIICSGSESVMPSFLPASPRLVDSRGFLALRKLPTSLLVLGGGVIGCEFACMAAQLGAKVTIVELLEDVLAALDRDIRQPLRRHMQEALGIRILTGNPLEGIEAGASGVRGRFGDKSLESEMLLVSVGRRPVTAGLALDKVGIAPTARGSIPIDGFCRTASATVFAAGDVTDGSSLLAHAATAQGVAAAENALRPKSERAERLVPSCIFTSPEVGTVGLSEESARAAGRNVATGKFHFAGLGRAMAAAETAGFVKWIADADTGQLLGAAVVGAHATELIAEAAVAVRAELTAAELGRTVHCHPTYGEAWMEAAHALDGACIHAPPRRR